MLVEREIRRQLFDYHEAMNRADYDALTALLGDAVITVCDAPRHRARTEAVSSLRPDQRTGVIHGGEQFVAGCRATWLTYGEDPRMQFGATNVVVDVADSLDTATCHAYFFLFQGLGPRDHPADRQSDDSADSADSGDQVSAHPLEDPIGQMAAHVGLQRPREFPLQVISSRALFRHVPLPRRYVADRHPRDLRRLRGGCVTAHACADILRLRREDLDLGVRHHRLLEPAVRCVLDERKHVGQAHE
jgi:hypothetical protein